MSEQKLTAPLQKLYQEVNALHGENVSAAQGVAENVVKIGIKLWQIKEEVGHGKFMAAMELHCPTVTQQTCSNYMRLAKEMVVEKQIQLLTAPPAEGADQTTEGKLPTVGNLEAEVVGDVGSLSLGLANTKARELVAEMNWSQLPFTTEELVKEIKGKQITEVYREYGVTRQPKQATPGAQRELSPTEKADAELKQAEAVAGDIESSVLLSLESDGALWHKVSPLRRKSVRQALIRLSKFLKTVKGGKIKTHRNPKKKGGAK